MRYELVISYYYSRLEFPNQTTMQTKRKAIKHQCPVCLSNKHRVPTPPPSGFIFNSRLNFAFFVSFFFSFFTILTPCAKLLGIYYLYWQCGTGLGDPAERCSQTEKKKERKLLPTTHEYIYIYTITNNIILNAYHPDRVDNRPLNIVAVYVWVNEKKIQ